MKNFELNASIAENCLDSLEIIRGAQHYFIFVRRALSVNIILRLWILLHSCEYHYVLCSAVEAQSCIKLEHYALDYAYTTPRSSATRGQYRNGEFSWIAYSTAKISCVSTVYCCFTAKSSPLLDSLCRVTYRNELSAA